CDDVSKYWYPASHDLAFILFNTAVRVRSAIGKPGARRRQHIFAEGVLRAFVETIHPLERRRWLLDEIHACARAHLKSLDPSLSLRGLWHAVLGRAASRRIDRVVAKLRTELGVPIDGDDPNVNRPSIARLAYRRSRADSVGCVRNA